MIRGLRQNFKLDILLELAHLARYLYSRDIVGYTISDRPVLSMVTGMLEKAFQVIPDGTNLILHSDQGWQYQHKRYQQMRRASGRA